MNDKGYFGTLFDTEFRNFITPAFIKVLYVIGLVVIAFGALGVVFAGDLITVYVFWELMAVTSCVLIFARRSRKSFGAGIRYLLVHIFGGLVLLAGILLTIAHTGSIGFDTFSERHAGTWLILIGFLVNAAAPPLSAWLSDAYPEATITGGGILSAYTSKTAVYALLRGYGQASPNWDILVVVRPAAADASFDDIRTALVRLLGLIRGSVRAPT